MGSHKDTERGHIIIPNQIMKIYHPFNFLPCKYIRKHGYKNLQAYIYIYIIHINSYTKAPMLSHNAKTENQIYTKLMNISIHLL